MARQMDVANVDSRGRYLVVDSIFMEMMKDEDSRLLNADFGGAGSIDSSGFSVSAASAINASRSSSETTIGKMPFLKQLL